MTSVDLLRSSSSVDRSIGPAAGEFRASPRHLLAIFLLALAVRFLALVVGTHGMPGGAVAFASEERFDAYSYIQCAKAYLGEPAALRPIDLRVFPGYPFAIAAVHLLGLPVPHAALAVSWLAAALAAVLAAQLYQDWRMGWAMVLLTPQYLISSTAIFNESLLLAACCAALLAGLRGRSVLAGLVFGFAGAVRPNACFALAGYALYELYHRRWRRAAVVSALAALVVAAAALFLRFRFGDALVNVKTYNQPGAFDHEILTWPFKSLILTPLTTPTPLWKIAYVWSNLLLVLLACGAWLRRWIRSPHPFVALQVGWLLPNTLFIVSMGTVWGFSGFARSLCWALPPALAAYHPFLPRRWWAWTLLGGLSFAMSVVFLRTR